MTAAFTYADAITYLTQTMNYETQTPGAYDPEHFRVQAFADFLHTLGAPHQAFPSVHIAGSKGKGSTAAMVAAILSQAGLQTGLFTSPHLVTLRERIQIDRHCISEVECAALIEALRTHVEAQPHIPGRRIGTFFELTTALGFLHFARHKVDMAVVEVGLGGRLDTTNVLTPAVAVLTPIGLEHTHILGATLPAIAGEKAGIVKPHSYVVSAPQAPEVVDVFVRRCQEQDATLCLADRDFQWQVTATSWQGTRLSFEGGGQCLADLEVALPGRHQAANAAVAIAVMQRLQQQGWAITEDHIRQGLATVRWDGRLEIFDQRPWVVFDAAHTVESAQCLQQALRELFPYQKMFLVLGMATDKNLAGIVATLAPCAQQVIVTQCHSVRACDPQILAAHVRPYGVPVHVEPDAMAAFAWARTQAQPSDLVCITGSLHLLGELKARLQGLPLEFS